MLISEFAALNGMAPTAVSRYLTAYYPQRFQIENADLEGGLAGYVRPSIPDDKAFADILKMRELILQKRAKNADIAAKIVLGVATQPLPPQIAIEVMKKLQALDERCEKIEIMVESIDKYVKYASKQRSSRHQELQNNNQDRQPAINEAEDEMLTWQEESERVMAGLSIFNHEGTNNES